MGEGSVTKGETTGRTGQPRVTTGKKCCGRGRRDRGKSGVVAREVDNFIEGSGRLRSE